MEEEKVISAPTEEQLWQQVIADFKEDPDPLEYSAILEQQGHRVILDIYNNHAVGFEAAAFTCFNTFLYNKNNFRFALRTKSFTDEVGKFFGMEDLILGFNAFDEKFIIKSNDEQKTVSLFADQHVRDTLLSLANISFGIIEYTMEDTNGKALFLELKIENAITDPLQLREIYNAFFKTLLLIEI